MADPAAVHGRTSARCRVWVGAVLVLTISLTACAPTGGGDAGDASQDGGPPENAAWFRAGDGRVTARYGGDQGWRTAGPAVDVTLMALDVEGASTRAVCVERNQWLAPGQAMAARRAEEAGIDSGGRAAWLAANHDTVSAPLETDDESAAVQLAVWHVVGDLTLDEIEDEQLAARVDQLVAASDGQSAPVGPTRIELELSGAEGGASVTVRLLGDDRPMAGEPVRVEGPGVDELVTTGADGAARVAVPGGGDVTARWEGSVPAGTVVEPADERGQALMTTEPVALVRTDGAHLEPAGGRPTP